jgi:hypothetical protein
MQEFPQDDLEDCSWCWLTHAAQHNNDKSKTIHRVNISVRPDALI